ncbi:hypothetical protein AXF42_Ash015164 [Apostasia shenzhenica]|uniref:Uncharacterized protein n=1 Tax=Apostasia shenzhenica TaxID=1088818 RepID=A0A2I0AQG4_9ASPA|nr:hypothetical protein AXF42_Ash015164 [Apostasia shenzhenica]
MAMALPAALARFHPPPAHASPSFCTPASLRARRLPPRADVDRRLLAGDLRHLSWSSYSSRTRCSWSRDIENLKESKYQIPPNEGVEIVNEKLDVWEAEASRPGISFLAKLAITLGIAATITLGSVYLKWSSSASSFSLPIYIAGSSQSGAALSAAGFTFTFMGYKIIIPELTPGGVCISDMIPFYLGRFFRQTKASSDICTKLGIGKEKAAEIGRAVQKYGNLSGFVERFSVGARNPTAFLAGASGISAECFFVGVCCGGLITLSIQLAVGFLLRERPVVALASVATVVGMWTVFPYLLAALTAVFIYLRR